MGETGYTCHQLYQNGSIEIQFSQPFYIGSMRLRLWDLDARRYSFNVYVSTDNQNWEEVCNRTFLTKPAMEHETENNVEPGETEPGEVVQNIARDDKKIIVGYSWQVIKFKPRPVCFVKITGTRNTANEVFHLVYFEAPACVPSGTERVVESHQNIEYVNAGVIHAPSTPSSSSEQQSTTSGDDTSSVDTAVPASENVVNFENEDPIEIHRLKQDLAV